MLTTVGGGSFAAMLLVIDNYDSFTFNLVQLLGELGAEPTVRRNDEVSVAEIERMGPAGIVISPGPCTPAEAGVSVECVRRLGSRVPMLGVCLGHQAIGVAYGARLVRGRRVMHGKRSRIRHGGGGLFAGLPETLTVTRYHSLALERASLPEALEVTAWTDEEGWEDEVQAVAHRAHPVWGVQFHPESVASEGGRAVIENFLAAL